MYKTLLTMGAVMALSTPLTADFITVDATANIFGAGQAINPDPAGGGGGTAPNSIALPEGTNRILTFADIVGLTNCCSNTPDTAPDGFEIDTDIDSHGPIAGIISTRGLFFAGVFLGTEIGDIAPDRLDNSDINFVSMAPGLAQTFFIGDGVTDGGTTQEFLIPDGATHLFLGFLDAYDMQGMPGYYDDNTGAISGSFNVVPAPGALALLGLAGLSQRRRRRCA